MSELEVAEFTALRAAITQRGTVRVACMVAGLSVWALVWVAVTAWLANPIAALVPLLLVWAAFEAVRVTHLGVERIGRYLQVFVEEAAAPESATKPPAWERSAMALGPRLPGAGGHPLFIPLLLSATLVNYIAVVLPGPLAIEAGLLAVPHAALAVWMLVCDRGMRRQRADELARFRQIRNSS